jgi:hypothetical protein
MASCPKEGGRPPHPEEGHRTATTVAQEEMVEARARAPGHGTRPR